MATDLAFETTRQPSPLLLWATRHRVALASLFLLLFPLVMPFKALAVMILIYGLYALGFNLLFGYLGLLSFGHSALFGDQSNIDCKIFEILNKNELSHKRPSRPFTAL